MRDGETTEAAESRMARAAFSGAIAFALALFAVRHAIRDESWMFLLYLGGGAWNAYFCLRNLSSPSPAPADKEG